MPRQKYDRTYYIFDRPGSDKWYIWWREPKPEKYPKGRQRQKSTKYLKSMYTKEQAQETVDSAEKPERSTGKGEMSVKWLSNHILKRLEIEDRPRSTIRQYRNSFDYLIEVVGAEFDIKLLNRSIVWKIKEYGFGKEYRGGTVSAITINTRLRYLHAAFNTLVKEDLLSENPFRYFERITEKQPEKKFLTIDELKTFLDTVNSWDNIDGKRLITLLIFTGLRRQELLLIERDDIDLFPPSPDRGENEPLGRFKAVNIKKKNRPKRWLSIPRKVHYHFLYFLESSTSPLPFKRCHPDTLSKWTKKLLVKAGLPEFHTHNLRHSFGTEALKRGMSIRDLQHYFDHSDVRVTEIYAHDMPDSYHKTPDIGL